MIGDQSIPYRVVRAPPSRGAHVGQRGGTREVGDYMRYEQRQSGGKSTYKYPLIWPGAKPKGKDKNESASYMRKCSVKTLRQRHKAFFAGQ